MKMIFVSNIDWTKMLMVVSAASVFWAGVASIVPQKYHTVVGTILSALIAAISFAMRGGKYVEKREDSAASAPPAK